MCQLAQITCVSFGGSAWWEIAEACGKEKKKKGAFPQALHGTASNTT